MTDPVPFARGGAYPPRPGNAARPLVDGEPAFRRIAAAVEAARASVWVTVAFVERDLVLPGARGARFLARWDHLPHYCHHQKSWLIDAGRPGEVAFVGGINLDHGSLVAPGHPPVGGGRSDEDIYANIHDLYLELSGPAATDVQ